MSDELFRLDLNVHTLAEEWCEQARRYYRYALELAEARREHERCKAEFDVVVAELDRDVRSSPSDFGITSRVTNELVDRTIVLQVRHHRAQQKLIESKHLIDVCQAVVSALEHKKKALEALVHLSSRALQSEPYAPREEMNAMAEAEIRQVFSRKKGDR